MNMNNVNGNEVNQSNVVNQTMNSQVNNASGVNNNQVNNGNNGEKSYKKLYIWMGIIVGIVLIVAVILMINLLNGSIENRNRLTCTKTTQENGYDYSIKRYYTFENDLMKRVYFTYTFEYKNELTDDMYNQTFDEIINNTTHGSTKYGLGTNIEKIENTVKITSYEPNYYSEMYDDIKKSNKKEGFSCE